MKKRKEIQVNEIVVMTPTVLRATWLMREVYKQRAELLKVISIGKRKIVMKDGNTFFFVGETEGLRVLKGFHGKTMSEAEFMKKFELR